LLVSYFENFFFSFNINFVNPVSLIMILKPWRDVKYSNDETTENVPDREGITSDPLHYFNSLILFCYCLSLDSDYLHSKTWSIVKLLCKMFLSCKYLSPFMIYSINESASDSESACFFLWMWSASEPTEHNS